MRTREPALYRGLVILLQTTNCGFAVNGFTSPVCPYLELKIRGWYLAAAMLVFIHPLTSILAEKLSSKLRFFEIEFDNQEKMLKKSRISSQTWDCDILGCKKTLR